MKKNFLFALIAASLAVVACSPKAEKAAEEPLENIEGVDPEKLKISITGVDLEKIKIEENRD